jgi:hypothetical protein
LVILYCYDLGVTTERVWIGEWIYWPNTHFTRNYKQLQIYRYLHTSQITIARLSPFPARYLFISRSLATASNSGDSIASRAQVRSSQSPVQNSTLNRLSVNWQLNGSPQPSSRSPLGTHHTENTPVSIAVVQLLQLPSNRLHNTVSNSNSIIVEACLPCRYTATAVVSFVLRSLPSNGSIYHNIIIGHYS